MASLEEYRARKREEQERRAKRKKNMTRFTVIFMAVVLLLVALYYICFLSGWSYYNKGEDFVVEENVIKTVEKTSEKELVSEEYRDLSLVFENGKLAAYNISGKTRWSLDVQITNPILEVSGKYILLADRNGKNVYIIKNGKIMLEYQTEYIILAADINKNGTVITVTDDNNYKNRVSVRKASGKEIFVWHSATSYVVDAAISDNQETVMLTTLSTYTKQDGKKEYTSGVKTFSIKEGKEISNKEFEESIAVSVFYAKNGYIVLSDKEAVKYDDRGEHPKKYTFNGKCGKFSYDKPYLAVVYIDEHYNNHLVILNEHLEVKAEKNLENMTIDSLDILNSVVSYRVDNEIYLSKLNLKVRYRIKTKGLYDDIALFSRGKRIAAINENGVSIIEAK